jgi:DUF1365 family protein
MTVQHLAGHTFHGRKGAVANNFRYSIDYVLLDAEASGPTPALFSRNRGNIAALHDADHGGPPKQGQGAAWLRQVLSAHGLPSPTRVRLLAQPRLLGHVFNPVAFWLAEDASGLRAFVAEHHVAEPKRRKRPESFRTLTDRFGNPASISTDKVRGGGGHG